ncbi:MAG: hypothetical protein E7070_11620 [Bacteroidales bacterium]|jgi:hypothetical protein|nr:hypothetical protein [Bacteroidales bacterium]
MKKLSFLMALAAVAGLFVTACSEEDETGNGVTVLLTDPATKDLAAKYSLDKSQLTGLEGVQIVEDGVSAVLSEIEVTEDNGIIFTYEEQTENSDAAMTRAGGGLKKFWKWHTFSADGDEFAVAGFGKIIIKTSDDDIIPISLIPEGYGTIEDVLSNVYKPKFVDELSNYLCRTWTINAYRVIANVDATNVGTSWTKIDGNCNLKKIMEDLNSKHNANLDVELGDKEIVESITFSGNETFQIKYKDSEDMDEGAWDWTSQDATKKSGAIAYVWYDEKMGNDLLGGVATVSFKGEECRLKLSAKAGKSCETQIEFKLK